MPCPEGRIPRSNETHRERTGDAPSPLKVMSMVCSKLARLMDIYRSLNSMEPKQANTCSGMWFRKSVREM